MIPYFNCKAVILASRRDMPLFTNAETAKKAPVQNGDSPLLRVTSGLFASSHPPTPMIPKTRNMTKYSETTTERNETALYSTPPSSSRSAAERP